MQRPVVDLPQPDSPTTPEGFARLAMIQADAVHRVHMFGATSR